MSGVAAVFLMITRYRSSLTPGSSTGMYLFQFSAKYFYCFLLQIEFRYVRYSLFGRSSDPQLGPMVISIQSTLAYWRQNGLWQHQIFPCTWIGMPILLPDLPALQPLIRASESTTSWQNFAFFPTDSTSTNRI